MSRRRSKARRRKGGGLLVKLVVFGVVVGTVGWLGATMVQLWQKIEPLPAVNGHDFIATSTQSPVLVIAQQSNQAAQLDSLTILKADFEQRTVAALRLPLNLSDGVTEVGQYLESHYYKEMQLAIEGQLALAVTGYIIQPRVTEVDRKTSLVESFSLHTPPDWWSTTIGLPLWLDSASSVATNLSEWQLLQLAWLLRDLPVSQSTVVQLPATAKQTTDGKLQLVPDVTDPIVQNLFISDAVRHEATSIVVKNATHVDGLAALASRFVANMGGEVIAVEPADTAQTGSSITAETNTSLTRSINQFLGVPTTIQPQTGRERADVELVIGTDALSRLGK